MLLPTLTMNLNALNWAVAQCQNEHVVIVKGECRYGPGQFSDESLYCPSESWDQGGPIIQSAGIDTRQIKRHSHAIYEYRHIDRHPDAEVIAFHAAYGPERRIKVKNKPGINEGKWLARMSVDHHNFGWTKEDFLSDTPLEAAMRCYVTKMLGKEVDIPEELIKRRSKK